MKVDKQNMIVAGLCIALYAFIVVPMSTVSPAEKSPEPEAVQADAKSPVVSKPAGGKVTQRIGENKEWYKKFGVDGHTGEDIQNDCGQPVKSPTNGRITDIAEDPKGYGHMVKIKGYDGAEHWMGHTASGVTVGTSVLKGNQLGTTDLSGNTTGCHVHWSVLVGGKFYDPDKWQKEPEACPKLTEVPIQYGVPICAAATKYNADPSLVAAIIWYENRGWPNTDKNVCSPMGACGIAQFMPKTFEQYGVDGDGDGKATREGWLDSIYSAANYIGQMKKDWRDTAITYNNSWKNVGKSDDQLPAETADYVRGIQTKYDEFSI